MGDGWRTSSRSAYENCVEVRVHAEGAQVRHSRHTDGPVLTFTAQEWAAFLAGVRLAEFDLPASDGSA